MQETSTVIARFFGDFSVRINGRSVDRWHAGKSRNLFQYLLVSRGHVVRREKLFEVLWPGSEWSPNASSLKVAVHSVRRILDGAADGAADPPVEIRSRDQGYLLHTNDVWMDIDEFDLCMSAGRAAEASGDPGAALAAYRRAADLYRGDFLAAQAGDWIEEQRQCYRSFAIYALTRLHADALTRGNHSKVIELCRRIIGIDPYHEGSYQALMLMHGRRGEAGQVRAWYRLCVDRLRSDLELPPTERTMQVFTEAMRNRTLPMASTAAF